jgi:hypothetical protein
LSGNDRATKIRIGHFTDFYYILQFLGLTESARTNIFKTYCIDHEAIHFKGNDMTQARIQKLEELFQMQGPILKSAALRSGGFCGKDVAAMIELGQLAKVRRGYYAWNPSYNELNGMEVVSSLIPEGVVSLFSAAQYHDMTTVIPQSIEITLPASMRTPVMPENLHVTVYKSANHIYPVGIETVHIDNHTLKVYDRERTVCDFMRFRLKIGKDVALEVLKTYMNGKKNMQKLHEYAKLLQIEGVIHPYLEVLV